MPTPNANVKAMQQALIAYANATGFSAANPGAADGIVGTRTLMAVFAIIPQLPGVPSEIKSIAQFGPVALTDSTLRTKAEAFVTSNAKYIHDAIIGLAAYQAAQGKTPGSIQLPVGPTAPYPSPAAGNASIYFFDSSTNMYRIAVPAGLMGLGASYVEVAPSPVRPSSGTMVSKTTFLTDIGKWYETWWGLGLMAAGGLTVVGGTFLLVRRPARSA